MLIILKPILFFFLYGFRNKKIIPISFDETCPYGLFENSQSRFIKDMSVELIVSEGLMEIESNFNGFIYLLKKASSFRWAEEILRIIKPYFNKLNKKDVNAIIDISLKNTQICFAAECVNKYLPELLETRKDDIEPDLLNKIVSRLENQ